jgi:hypothetical protein
MRSAQHISPLQFGASPVGLHWLQIASIWPPAVGVLHACDGLDSVRYRRIEYTYSSNEPPLQSDSAISSSRWLDLVTTSPPSLCAKCQYLQAHSSVHPPDGILSEFWPFSFISPLTLIFRSVTVAHFHLAPITILFHRCITSLVVTFISLPLLSS